MLPSAYKHWDVWNISSNLEFSIFVETSSRKLKWCSNKSSSLLQWFLVAESPVAMQQVRLAIVWLRLVPWNTDMLLLTRLFSMISWVYLSSSINIILMNSLEWISNQILLASQINNSTHFCKNGYLECSTVDINESTSSFSSRPHPQSLKFISFRPEGRPSVSSLTAHIKRKTFNVNFLISSAKNW